jgi:hypothetical protein
MENIKVIEVESIGGIQAHIIIDRGNGEYTSMLKSTYEAQQAEHFTPMIPGDE